MTHTAIIQARYSTPGQARTAVYNWNNPSKYSLILGDDGKVWVTTNKEASRLVKAGYEMLPFFM
jgi:hypothetical protein